MRFSIFPSVLTQNAIYGVSLSDIWNVEFVICSFIMFYKPKTIGAILYCMANWHSNLIYVECIYLANVVVAVNVAVYKYCFSLLYSALVSNIHI